MHKLNMFDSRLLSLTPMHAAEEADVELARQYRGALNALMFYVREVNGKVERRSDDEANASPTKSKRLGCPFDRPAGISRE